MNRIAGEPILATDLVRRDFTVNYRPLHPPGRNANCTELMAVAQNTVVASQRRDVIRIRSHLTPLKVRPVYTTQTGALLPLHRADAVSR